MTTKLSTTRIDFTYDFSSQFGESEPNQQHPGVVFERTNEVEHGEEIPKFRDLIRLGMNATTNLSASVWNVEQSPFYFRSEMYRTSDGGDKRRYLASGNTERIALPSVADSISTTEASNQALANFYSHLASVDTSFKGMVFSGEILETLRMLRHPFKALRGGMDHYLSFLRKNGPRLPMRSRPSFVRRTWLEYSYGWAPLISDCQSAIDAFYRSRTAHPIFEMVRGRGYSGAIVGSAPYSNFPVSGQFLTGFEQEKQESEVKFYGIYHSTGSGESNSRQWGFRPAEFIPTLWELIPYSFLVDYFSNAGKVIESWSYRSIGARFISSVLY